MAVLADIPQDKKRSHTKNPPPKRQWPPPKIRHSALEDPERFLKRITSPVLEQDGNAVLADMIPGTGMHLTQEELVAMKETMEAFGLKSKALLLMRDPLARSLSELRAKITNRKPGFEIPANITANDQQRAIDLIAEKKLNETGPKKPL